MNLLMYMAPIAVVFLLPATLIMEEDVVGITLALARDDIRIVWYLLFNSSLAYFVNLTNFLVTKHTSALTLQVFPPFLFCFRCCLWKFNFKWFLFAVCSLSKSFFWNGKITTVVWKKLQTRGSYGLLECMKYRREYWCRRRIISKSQEKPLGLGSIMKIFTCRMQLVFPVSILFLHVPFGVRSYFGLIKWNQNLPKCVHFTGDAKGFRDQEQVYLLISCWILENPYLGVSLHVLQCEILWWEVGCFMCGIITVPMGNRCVCKRCQ